MFASSASVSIFSLRLKYVVSRHELPTNSVVVIHFLRDILIRDLNQLLTRTPFGRYRKINKLFARDWMLSN